MAAAIRTALCFRSMVASKMARALLQHRVIAARGLHGGTSSSSSPQPSRLRTSSGNEDLAARNQEVLRQVRDHLADLKLMQDTNAHFKATTNTCITVLVLGASLLNTFVCPELKRLEDREDALSRRVFKLKQDLNKMKNIKDEHILYFHNVYVVLPFNIVHFDMCNRSQEHMIMGQVDISFG